MSLTFQNFQLSNTDKIDRPKYFPGTFKTLDVKLVMANLVKEPRVTDRGLAWPRFKAYRQSKMGTPLQEGLSKVKNGLRAQGIFKERDARRVRLVVTQQLLLEVKITIQLRLTGMRVT